MLTKSDILTAASERPSRLTYIVFGYYLDGEPLYAHDETAVKKLVVSGQLEVETSIYDHLKNPVVLTAAGRATLIDLRQQTTGTAPYSPEVGRA